MSAHRAATRTAAIGCASHRFLFDESRRLCRAENEPHSQNCGAAALPARCSRRAAAIGKANARSKRALRRALTSRSRRRSSIPAESACTAASADESLASPHPWTINTRARPNTGTCRSRKRSNSRSPIRRCCATWAARWCDRPQRTRTAIDPAIAETDPRFGIEAALSEFDAQFLTSTFWEKNDRALNNEFFGGGTTLVQQDVGVFQAAITKRAVTGSQFTIRHNVDYDANNSPGNLFDSAWNTNVEAEIRHPLLQGSGVQFNRIAGPNNLPGVYNGVLIARLNTDVALTDFEIAVRDLVSNVENAYWDLYFGYRVLDARVQARDAALDTWRRIYALYEVDRRGGEAEKEAQAREQYFRFQQDVQNAMSGEPYEQTRNWNGLPSGAFRTTGGVLHGRAPAAAVDGPAAERRPADAPDRRAGAGQDRVRLEPGDDGSHDAARRAAPAEVADPPPRAGADRQQELPVAAAGRRGPLPLARIRRRPVPDQRAAAARGSTTPTKISPPATSRNGNSASSCRCRSASARHTSRRATPSCCWPASGLSLRDQQREIVHEAADAIAEMDRAYAVLQTSYNRLVASQDQLKALAGQGRNRRRSAARFVPRSAAAAWPKPRSNTP